MTHARRLGVAALVSSFLGPAVLAETPGALAVSRTEGVVLVEMIVEDAKGQVVTNLKPAEVELQQDGARQVLRSLDFRPQDGYYELVYAPSTGRAGAVAIRVLRGGSRMRGPDGPQVKPRWLPPTPAFEEPLRAALDLAVPPAELRYELEVLRFEERQGTLHHSFVAQIPLGELGVDQSAAGVRVQLSFLLRVKTEAGRIVHVGSLDQPLEVEGGGLSAKRFIWTSHLHLRPGRYVAEVVVRDGKSQRRSVRRMPVDVEAWSRGLRTSSLVFLLGADGLMQGEAEDNPFRLENASLVPMLRPTWVAGSDGPLYLLADLFPSTTSTEPVRATMELHRDGALRAKVALPLPAPGTDGSIRYLGGLAFKSLQPGAYDLKLVAEQGTERFEERGVLTVVSPQRIQ